MGGLPAQHLLERAGLLAGPDHVDDQVGEDMVLAGHGLGQAPALGDILLELSADLARDPLG